MQLFCYEIFFYISVIIIFLLAAKFFRSVDGEFFFVVLFDCKMDKKGKMEIWLGIILVVLIIIGIFVLYFILGGEVENAVKGGNFIRESKYPIPSPLPD